MEDFCHLLKPFKNVCIDRYVSFSILSCSGPDYFDGMGGGGCLGVMVIGKFIKYLSLIPFATFQVILFQSSYLMGCLCVNIWQLYAIMTIQKSDQK